MPVKEEDITKGNVGKLPNTEAVYSLWTDNRFSKELLACKYVGETEHLRGRIQEHFSEEEKNPCLKKFMQSNNKKIIKYELMPSSTKEQRRAKESEWMEKYKPECNRTK